MGRPSKKDMALKQAEELRAQGLTDESIRAKLVEAGLTVAQAEDVVPKPEEPKPTVVSEGRGVGEETRKQVMEEAAQFLEYAHKRLQTCKPEHAGIRGDMLVWARRLKGAK